MNALLRAHLLEGNAPSLPHRLYGNDGALPSRCSGDFTDPSASTLAVRFRRSIVLATLGLLIASAIPSRATAMELETIAGGRTTLAEAAPAAKTLVLVASAEPDLREGFRLLTLAHSRQLPALLLVALPEDNPLQTATIKKAAKRFLNSDFSRQRILFVSLSELLRFNGAKALLLDQSEDPLWQAPHYPTDADFETTPFQP